MSRTTDIRELMEKLHAANNELKRVLREHGTVVRTKQELELITAARNKFHSAYRRLFDEYLDPLDARFRSGDEQVVDEVIAFLATDVPAIRCGYLKEKWLRRLKSASLSQAQKQRLMRAALSLCASSHYQREIAEWNRLMIKLADKETVTTLLGLTESDNPFVKSKSRHMLYGILQNRNDIIQPDYLRQALLFHVRDMK
jgi:hypothetical protein